MPSDDDQAEPATRDTSVRGATRDRPKAVPQFALKAVDRQSERAAKVMTTTADSIEHLVAASPVPLPESAAAFVQDAIDKLRTLSQRANDGEAAELLEGLQEKAAAHPVAAAGIGAAIGAALGLALSQLQRLNRRSEETPASRA